LTIHWHIQFTNLTIRAENFPHMSFVDILGKLFDDNLKVDGIS
jgi:hypothetical protein